MINESQARKYCREDISLIKNYAEAIADAKRVWICHHINAEPFTGFCTKDLKKLNMYKHRPASELTFVTRNMHQVIHGANEESRKKMSNAHKGKTPWNKGKSGYSCPHPNRRKNLHWYNNGTDNIMSEHCPDGYTPGKLQK